MSKRVFFHGAVPDVAGEIIAGSASTRAIDAVKVVNHTASSAMLTMWQVPSAGSRANANLVLFETPVAAGGTVSLNYLFANEAIAQNASIHAQASAASALTLIMSGRVQ